MSIFRPWPRRAQNEPQEVAGGWLGWPGWAGLAGLAGEPESKYPNVTQNLSDLKFPGRAQPMARCRATVHGWPETGWQVRNGGKVKQSA